MAMLSRNSHCGHSYMRYGIYDRWRPLVYIVLTMLDKLKCIFVFSFYDFWFIVCVKLPSQSYVLLSVTSLKLSVLKKTLRETCQNRSSNKILLCKSLGLMTLMLRRF